ncbi:MAG: MarR family winged helix-turn-helix transcriptional regulator, partial [Spirochaetia bacterium]|nr:MarR family winged helix-turn-helix transcriptional regulator [Spirochaetia bacterium]
IALSLRKTARVVSSIYDESVRRAGIRTTQFQILAGVSFMPGISITGLSESIDADRTTIQRSLDRLVKRGLIASGRASSGNVRELNVTYAGEKKLAEAYEYWASAQKQVVRAIGATNARNLLRELKTIRSVNA